MYNSIIFLYSRNKWLGKVGTLGKETVTITADGRLYHHKYNVGEDDPIYVFETVLSESTFKSLNNLIKKYKNKIKNLSPRIMMHRTGDIYDIEFLDSKIHGIIDFSDTTNSVIGLLSSVLTQAFFVVNRKVNFE